MCPRRREERGRGLFKDDKENNDERDEFDDAAVPFETIEETLNVAVKDVKEPKELDWKQDVGERSRRIYEWWRVIMNERKHCIPNFQQAVRLVATVQASSAAVERVFSQLTFIRRAVGDRTSSDVMEMRAFIRCNSSKVNDYEVNGL